MKEYRENGFPVTIVRPSHTYCERGVPVAPKEYDFTGNLLGDKSVTVIFDCSKLKRAVPGFQCVTRFDEGVRRCFFRNNDKVTDFNIF